MASLRELKNTWQIRYYDSDRDPTEVQDSLPKGEYTEHEAEREAGYRQELYDRGEYDPWRQEEPGAAAQAPGDPTLLELAELYVEEKRRAGERGESGGWTEKTYKSDAPILLRFARKTGPVMQASRLRTSHIRDYIYQEDLANATKRGYHRRVRAMLRWASDRGLIAEQPSMPPAPKKRESITETITEAELLDIFRAHWSIPYSAPWHPQMWAFLFYQGLRPGEAYDLRIGNVYPEKGQIQIGDHTEGIRAKSGDEALIPLLQPGRFYLRPFLEGFAWDAPPSRDPSDRVFDAGPGARRPSSSWKRAARKAAEISASAITEARAERISMYTLRHSCATHWLKEGRSLIWVNRLLRHSQVQTTMEYVHLTGVDIGEM